MADHTKHLLQCVEAIRPAFRELAAFYLLPTPTARALTLHFSDDCFTAITTIVINAESVLHHKLKVLAADDLHGLVRYKQIFTAIAYGKAGATTDQLEYKRQVLYNHFNHLYKFIHFSLSELLPITYNRSCPSTTVVSTSQSFNRQFARVWLLAITLLPQDVAIKHIKVQTYAIELSVFREIAQNLLGGWFQLNKSLQERLIDKYKQPLQSLAAIDTANHKQILQLIVEAYPAIKFACDILTHYGCRELFPGFVPWHKPTLNL